MERRSGHEQYRGGTVGRVDAESHVRTRGTIIIIIIIAVVSDSFDSVHCGACHAGGRCDDCDDCYYDG